MADRILVADDNPVNRYVVRSVMERAGFLVDAVDSGVNAVAAFMHHRYCVILMDLEMPEMDGYATALTIRGRERERGLRPTPIIALTSLDTPESRVLSAAAGMDDYQTKPVDAAKLSAAVRQWMQNPTERLSA